LTGVVEEQVGIDVLRADDSSAEPEKGGVSPKNALNDLTAREWIPETKSFWYQKGLGAKHEHAEIERLHPAPFSYQDVARLVRFFTKEGESVLDPFCGVGSTLKACATTGRRGVGIELMPTWADLAELRLEREVPDESSRMAQRVIRGDARVELSELEGDSFRFAVTSPPYWNILNKVPDHKVLAERVHHGLSTSYGEDGRDLGNIDAYNDFIDEVVAIFAGVERVVMRGGHLAIIVGDFRHKAIFYPFHADLCRELPKRSGWVLQGVTVLLQNHKRLFPYGYPYAFVPNIHHQNILIFRRLKK
jgi:DNA modification methylase